jgi:hypothetical protein
MWPTGEIISVREIEIEKRRPSTLIRRDGGNVVPMLHEPVGFVAQHPLHTAGVIGALYNIDDFHNISV